ncbi:hypothetical protein AAG906_020892 [Vitis piasezkii]
MANRLNRLGNWSRSVKNTLSHPVAFSSRLRDCVRAHWSRNPSVRGLEAWLKLQVSGTLTRPNRLRGNGYSINSILYGTDYPYWKTRMTWFTDIVNGLEALGKTYKESEKVMKILRSLPSKWHTKSIALKATTKEEEDVEEEKPSEEDDDLALITRKLNKYMRNERFRGRKFTSRRDPSKKESSSHGDKEKWEDKRDLVCFKCKNRDISNMIVVSTKVKQREE